MLCNSLMMCVKLKKKTNNQIMIKWKDLSQYNKYHGRNEMLMLGAANV